MGNFTGDSKIFHHGEIEKQEIGPQRRRPSRTHITTHLVLALHNKTEDRSKGRNILNCVKRPFFVPDIRENPPTFLQKFHSCCELQASLLCKHLFWLSRHNEANPKHQQLISKIPPSKVNSLSPLRY
jgi:hypothetical protein